MGTQKCFVVMHYRLGVSRKHSQILREKQNTKTSFLHSLIVIQESGSGREMKPF